MSKLVKPQDADRWLIYLLRNRYVGDTAWDWMVANWDWIVKTYGNDKSYDMLPRYAATACNTPATAVRYKGILPDAHDGPNSPQAQHCHWTGRDREPRKLGSKRDLSSVQDYFK